VTASVTRIGTRSRDLSFEARVLCRAAPERGPSAADVLDPPILATKASATIVVPPKTEGDRPSA
jgi:3-aminobutyryl-CoA ammonia-lyase